MNMALIETEMRAVASDLEQDQGLPPGVVAASDFLNWLMELAEKLIPFIMGCFPASTAKAVEAMNSPNFFQRWRLRAFLRGEMRDGAFERQMLYPLERSLSKLGASMTNEKWQAIMAV